MTGAYLRAEFLAAAACALLAACDNPRSAAADVAPSATVGKAKAGDDFYTHVNGDWLASYELPPDEPWHGVTEELRDAAEADVHAIIEELAASKPEAGTTAAKIADFYASAIDLEAVEARGIEPLQPHLDRIAAIQSREDLIRVWAIVGYASPINLGVAPHPDDTDRPAVWLAQGGLGMPHRGYYLDPGVELEQLRDAYRKHIATIMSLLGHEDSETVAGRIFALEQQIAAAHTADDRRLSMERVFRTADLATLKRGAPAMDWDLFLSEAGFGGATSFVVTDGAAVRDCAELLDTVGLDDWKAWLAFHFANSFAYSLPKAFADSAFEFNERRLMGVSERSEPWRLAVQAIQEHLGEAVGQIYVERHFPPGHKQGVETLIANMGAAFETRLRDLDWMDGATRAEALAKLQDMEALVGHPDRWRDYSKLEILSGKLFENTYNVMLFEMEDNRAELLRPVDRDKWPIPPQIVNAMYNPLGNRLCLPAGILQPPFFDPDADAAWNYGGIGGVIGHEISHGFDDRGRQFDRTGARRNWWTPETNARFLKFSARLIVQYSGFCPSLGQCVNGLGSLGENIGDLAGLQIAYDAYKASLGGKEAPVIDGLTGDQRFFISYARSYRMKARDEIFRMQLQGDHPPNIYRVNGVVRNMDAWYDAFDVKPGDRLYLKPEDRVRIW